MRADRLVSLILLLQTRGKATAADLAARLEVSPRTILRDIEALSTAGIPVIAEGGHGGGIALDEGYRTSLTGLKDAETRSLFLTGSAPILHDIGLGKAAESLLLKLAAAVPRVQQPSVDHIRQRIHIDPLWWWHDSTPPPFWDDLQKAVYEDRPIRVVYENYNRDVTARDLEPYSLVAKSSFWYLIARREGEMRTYRVSRLREVSLLPGHFARDPGFDLADYWQAHLGEFTAAMAGYGFTLRLHPDRLNFVRWLTPGRCDVVSSEADGWLIVNLSVDNAELAKMMVFGLGQQAQIVAPDELREAVMAGAREMLDLTAGFNH